MYYFLKDCYKRCINGVFYLRNKKHKAIKKIIYVLTPSANLSNVGDHSQALAIKQWLEDSFKDCPILEFDKDEVYRYIYSLKRIINSDDLIFLHSGGNLGDRGMWSENARRLIIQNFPHNKIISLPQTIFFSDTERGRRELQVTKTIYNSHRDLTIMARDEYSFGLAKEYFPKCKAMLFPDFVLYLPPVMDKDMQRTKILLCLRKDNESAVDKSAKNVLTKTIASLGCEYDEFDTTLHRDILRGSREKEFKRTIEYFSQHKVVITDRFHGVIFAVITNTPCVALKTVDHKLPSSAQWFRQLNYVWYINDYNCLSDVLNKALSIAPQGRCDWRNSYFDGLKAKLFDASNEVSRRPD